jgi:tetrahydromethanopterin S-methyltransferase subunit B
MKKNFFLTALIVCLIAPAVWSQIPVTSPWVGNYTPISNYLVLLNPTTVFANGGHQWVNEVQLVTNGNLRLRLHPDGLFQFYPRTNGVGFSVANHPANDATITTQGGGNISGFASFAGHTSDWQQNIQSLVNRAASASYVVNYNGADRFYVAGAGWLYANGSYFGSDSTLKRNIQPIEKSLAKVMQLQGVTYNLKPEKKCEDCSDDVVVQSDESTHMGFIAQEVELVVPEVVRQMPTGIKAVAYQNMVALTVEAIQEQQAQIEDLQAQVDDLNASLAAYCSNPSGTTSAASSSPRLLQNVPNPTGTTTRIGFEGLTNGGELLLLDLSGKLLQSYPLKRDATSLELNTAEMAEGVYLYSLVVNGAEIDSKRMLVRH